MEYVEPRSGNAIVAGRSSFLPTERSHSGLMKRHPELRQSRGSAESIDPEKQTRMHHQAFDEARLGKRHATTEKMRPKDRPLEGDFLSDEEYAEKLREWFGQIARMLEPGRSAYIWGGYANLFAVAFIFYRDALVASVRTVAAYEDVIVAARFSGKAKAVVQSAGITAVLVIILLHRHDVSLPVEHRSLARGIIWAVAAVTAASGIDYIKANWPLIKKFASR